MLLPTRCTGTVDADAADDDGAGAAVGVRDELDPQLRSGQANDPDIPEIEQSSGPAAAIRPPAVVANRTVKSAADDKASIERIDLLLSQSRSDTGCPRRQHAGPRVTRLRGTFEWWCPVVVQRPKNAKPGAGNSPTGHAELPQPAMRLSH